MRQAKVSILAQRLSEMRAHTLEAFECFVEAEALVVPISDELNPPLWELGHLAWFQEYWVARNQQRYLGIDRDAAQAHSPSTLAQADLWYDSARVDHDSRWSLPLLQSPQCLHYLHQTLKQTLASLQKEVDDSPALYFYWLALQHEAMHLEASTYTAQSLGIPFRTSWASSSISRQAPWAHIAATSWTMGRVWHEDTPEIFCFDNELGQRVTELATYSIARQAVTWAQYMPFVETTGYRLPLYVRASMSTGTTPRYEVNRFGQWSPMDLQEVAMHISWHDAQAYCAWAKCRLPTEAEWDCAAHSQDDFQWGQVWEWTADSFEPFDGFTPHPYAEYSAPWFGTHKVLRGAARVTHTALRHVNYRNFFTPDRRDIYAGFRVCV